MPINRISRATVIPKQLPAFKNMGFSMPINRISRATVIPKQLPAFKNRKYFSFPFFVSSLATSLSITFSYHVVKVERNSPRRFTHKELEEIEAIIPSLNS